jgi:UDP-N-acetylglucosamine--N-acetylmuramyl-(pentapeptide) pyrophosphoryl-undecaprenol N-acetylglucosamine transferase
MTSVLVAAAGGHLAQLHRLVERLDVIGKDRLWVTFDGPQSRSLLKDEERVFVPYVGPRDLYTAIRNTREAARILGSRDVDVVVSTGSAVAMSFLPLARLRGIPTMYIESAARSEGPSLTGRLLQQIPGIVRCTQYQERVNRKWSYVGSVFDDFVAVPKQPATLTATRPLSVVVTLGLIERYGFRRLIERLLAILPADAEVLWQVGDTNTNDLPIKAIRSLPWDELATAMRRADIVVAHTGIGSAIDAMESGKCPVLVPRQANRGEHVDDHQRQVAEKLAARGLAIHRSPEELTLDDLLATTQVEVRETVERHHISTGLADDPAAA